MSHKFKLFTIQNVYDWVTVTDSYDSKQNSLIWIYGCDDKNDVIIPIEIHSNFELINPDEFIILGPKEEYNIKYSIKWQFGNIILKSDNTVKVYKINHFKFSETFKQCVTEVGLSDKDAKVSIIDVSDNISGDTIYSLNPYLDQNLENKNDRMWKLIIEQQDDLQVHSLGYSVKEESKQDDSKGQSEIQQDLDQVEGSSLIDRTLIKTPEEFDVYESVIQGHSHYVPALSKDSCVKEDGSDQRKVFEYTFDKPISLFCLDVELYFEAEISWLKTVLSSQEKEPKEESKEVVQEDSQKQEDSIDQVSSYEVGATQNVEEVSIKASKKWLPLVVNCYEGWAFNATSQVSKLTTDDKRPFGANYAGSYFIFSHQFGKKFIIDQYIVMSENSSQIGAFPMGAGLLFISDSLAALENSTPFHEFTMNDFKEWREKRIYDPRPLEPYEPVAYFDMGNSVKLVDKIDEKSALSLKIKNSCRYVKLVPTRFKQTANNLYPQDRFTSYPIEFKFFGIIGEEVESKLDNDKYLDTYTTKQNILNASKSTDKYLVKVYDERNKSWEVVYSKEDNILLQEILTYGLNFNMSLAHLDQIYDYLHGENLTGIFKDSITNSKIQAFMTNKIRIEIESTENDSLWSFSGIKLFPKALVDIKHRNESVFSNISVKNLRSCFLDPKYFNAINKEITLILTDDQIDIDIKLRAISTLNLIISFNNKMIPLIFENLDFKKFLSILYKQDNKGWRYILGLFRKLYEVDSLSEQISKIVMSDLQNIHKMQLTSASLETFMNLISWQMFSNKEESFKILFEAFYYNITKESINKLHTSEYTILRKYVDSRQFPFDSISFTDNVRELKTGVNMPSNNMGSGENSKQYLAKLITTSKSKEYQIYLYEKCSISEIKLYFSQNLGKPYEMIIKVYGYFEQDESLIFSNKYSESLYSYLTQNSHLKEYGLYNESENRCCLSINKLNYTGSRLKIYIKFIDTFLTMNSESPVVDVIIPQIYGEEKHSVTNENIEKILIGEGELGDPVNVDIDTPSKVEICTLESKKCKIIRSTSDSNIIKNLPSKEQNDVEDNEQANKLLEKLQGLLKSKIVDLNTAKKSQRAKLVLEVKDLLHEIDEAKANCSNQVQNESDSIIESLEYQACLALKLWQMLLSIYKSDTKLFDEVLKNYPLKEIVYDLYVCYIIKDSQTSNNGNKWNNIHANEVYQFIKSVLLQSISDQEVIDELVIKILSNFILKSDPIYSQARIIESIENLPYSYDKIIEFAYSKLNQSEESILKSRNVEHVLENLDKSFSITKSSEDESSVKLLMTSLIMDNLKLSDDNQEKVSKSLKVWVQIIDWIVQNKLLDSKKKQFLLKMSLDLLIYLLKISKIEDLSEIIKNEEFLTLLSLTIFFYNSKDHNQQLANIFDCILSKGNTATLEELQKFNNEEIDQQWILIKNKLEILASSFKFWENIIGLLLNDHHVKRHYVNKSRWVEYLIFSLMKYLGVTEKLINLINHTKDNNEILNFNIILIKEYELSPNLYIILNLLNLLKQSKMSPQSLNQTFNYSKSQLMTLWSLTFEILGSADSEQVLKMNILEDLIVTLFESSIELQEVAYLSQTNFKVNPNPQFVWALLFQVLNKSIGTKHEQSAYTLCNKWLDILLDKPHGDDTANENIQVSISFNNTNVIASILEDTSNHLIKNLSLSHFTAMVSF